MKKNERLKKAIDYLRLHSIVEKDKDVAVRMKADPSNVSRAIKDMPTDKFLQRFNNAFDNVFNLEWLLTGEGEMLVDKATSTPSEEDSIYHTYLIPMSAMAGSLIGFDTDGMRPTDCERIVSPIAGVDFAISVYGDSMTPEFPSGSRVLIKRIDPTIYIDWGNVFVLDTTNGIILKEVQPSPKEGLLTCHSLNPNGRYKDFDVPMCEIRAMYKVLACVSLR